MKRKMLDLGINENEINNLLSFQDERFDDLIDELSAKYQISVMALEYMVAVAHEERGVLVKQF